MTTIRVGGVPEHFNLPWHLALEEGLFKQAGADVQWTDYPAGTGAMCKDLRNGALDVAVVLTEGIVADIINGARAKLIQWYVETPLIWGIHTSIDSSVDLNNMKSKKYAISRKGSGSHLMAFVDAKIRGLQIDESQFVLVENMNGARKALREGAADLFLWEKFMTEPLVDSGEFRRIGERPTPWPCFVIAASDEFISQNAELLLHIGNAVSSRADIFKNDQLTPALISQKFNLQPADALEWLCHTSWRNNRLDSHTLQNVIDTLYEIQVISKKVKPEELCAFPHFK